MGEAVRMWPPLAVLLLVAVPCAADDLTGQATVIDGDTLEIHGTVYLNTDAPNQSPLRMLTWQLGAEKQVLLKRNRDQSRFSRVPANRL
jgi:hypothetical protein